MNNFFNKLITRGLLSTGFLCVSIFIVSALHANAADTKPVLPEYVYTPSENNLLDVKSTLMKAKLENKLALIVLGSQWCHDSVGLAQRFSTNDMQAILAPRYITQFIDVGYLEDRRDITTLLGYPNYFATPTVLIVEPNSMAILNMDTITVWQSADSVDSQTYLEQFSKWSADEIYMKAFTASDKPQLRLFETQQSERLQRGYDVLGPLLEASDQPDSSARTSSEREEFLKLWREVKLFRTQVQASIHRLQQLDVNDEQLQKEIQAATPEVQSWEQNRLL